VYGTASKENTLQKKSLLNKIIHVREEERLKIGRELHDNVNQLLCAANLYLTFIIGNTEKEIFAKKQVDTIILSAIETIRGVSKEMVISQERNCNLKQQIAEMVNRINGTELFNIQFSYDDSPRLAALPTNKKLGIYRIIQEQLNNTVKYSKAANVQVRIYCNQEHIKVTVQDDGVGFDTCRCRDGIGLMNISERVKLQKGNMKLISSPGNGCCLNVTLPL